MARKLTRRLFDWLASHELGVLLGLLTVVAGSLGFILVADLMVEGRTQATDELIVESLRSTTDASIPIGPHWLREVFIDITALGGYTVLVMVTLCVAFYLWLDHRRSTLWFVVGGIVGGYALSMTLKATFARPRPEIVPHLTIVHSSSFPSGHSMMSAVVYITLGTLLARISDRRTVKAFFIAVPIALTLLIGFSRVFVGVHYPSDVLAGWSAGLAWTTLCWLVAAKMEARGRLR